MDTWLTRTLGIDVPLVQAPMARVRIGLLAWALDGEDPLLRAVMETDAAVVSVSFGPFEEPVERLKEAGKLVTTQVGTVAEARRAQRAGVDFVVARGREGGGHGRDDVSTLPLLQIVLEAVDVPVLAAGGVGTARGMAAVLAAGAEGAWVGTAFLCCHESLLPAGARQRLLAADENDTAYGRVFDIAQKAPWPPEYGGRALRNPFFERWQGREDELAGDEAELAGYAAARASGDFDTAAIYAGQGVGLLHSETTAADVVAGFAIV